MHNIDLILTLFGGLAAALIFGYITHRLGLSPIVGYLIGGFAVSRHTPGFTADLGLAEQLAEIGVILLMFGVGSHFHVEDLMKVRAVAIPGAIFQSVIATALGACAARFFGWSWEAGIVYGLAMAVASTVVLTRVLMDNRDLQSPTGHVAVGWLIVEDLFTVVVLVVLPAIFGPDSKDANVSMAIAFAIAKVGALAAIVLVLGSRIVPWLFEKVVRTASRELFTLTVLTTVLGIAVGSAKIFGVSMALGAFLAGMVVGRSEFGLRAASEALPMRDAFSVLFFVSVGMLLDPLSLMEHPGVLLATVAVVMIGKSLAAFVIVVALGHPLRVAIGTSVALAQIGEFSFILAALGRQLGLLTDVATNALVATSIISITLNPILYRMIDPVHRWAQGQRAVREVFRFRSRARKQVEDEMQVHDEQRKRIAPQAVVVGYGPVGKIVVRLLQGNGLRVHVVEMNLETVRSLNAEGIHALYGDISVPSTLEDAGIASASSLILSSTSVPNAKEVVREAKELNPQIRILARSAYARESVELRNAGCDVVFSGEGEVAFAMLEEILRDFGSTTAELVQERVRAREELYGNSDT